MKDLQGKVHAFNIDEGFGYLIAADGRFFFVHEGDINRSNPDETLHRGDVVLFEQCGQRSGNVATNVRKAT